MSQLPIIQCAVSVPRDSNLVIRFDALDAEQPFKLFNGDSVVAACTSPDRLGRWALDEGASSVRHAYDLVAHHAAMTFP